MLTPFSILLLFLAAWTSAESSHNNNNACRHLNRHWTPMAADKRVFRAPIAVKALVTALHDDDDDDDGKVLEVWVLDVYKGADKLATALGVLGGPGGVFNLRERYGA